MRWLNAFNATNNEPQHCKCCGTMRSGKQTPKNEPQHLQCCGTIQKTGAKDIMSFAH